MTGLISLLSKEIRFWTPVKQMLKKLNHEEIVILEKQVKSLENSHLQTDLMLMIWKEKKNCESVLKN